MRLAIVLSSLVALTLLSGCTAPPAADGSAGEALTAPVREASLAVPAALGFAADACRQAALLAPVEAEKAQALLPDGYSVYQDESGVAWFGASFTNCDAFTVGDDLHRTALNLAEMGILVTSPDGSGGIHAYQLLATTDAESIGRRLAAFGATGGLLESTAYETRSALLAATHLGDAPWPGLGVRMEAVSGAAATPFEAMDGITWWSETASGTLRLAYEYLGAGAAPAQGTLGLERGSPFEAALGGTQVDAGGFLFTHGFHAVAGLVDAVA